LLTRVREDAKCVNEKRRLIDAGAFSRFALIAGKDAGVPVVAGRMPAFQAVRF
jgi:hypothetical protein